MEPSDSYVREMVAVSQSMEEDMLHSMNVELNKQIAKDMEKIETYVIPDSPAKDPEKNPVDQDMDEEENTFQNMNAELDKQIAQDMEAIRTYISKNEDSVTKRIEFFNNIDSSHIDKCVDKTVTKHIFYQHTALGTIKWHECTQCQFRAKNENALREHIVTKHSDNSSWFACPYCPFSVKTKENLMKHLKMVHKKGEEYHRCDECEISFAKRLDLLSHCKHTHGATVIFCDRCSYATLDQSDLNQHIVAEHRKLNVSWYKCAQCIYRTAKKPNLDRHILYKHTLF